MFSLKFLNLSSDLRLVEVYGSTESLGPQMQGRWVPGSNRLGTVGKVDPSIAEGRVSVSEMEMVDVM